MSILNFFIPNRQEIESITLANPGVVTTTEDHGYLTGLYVRLFMPNGFGMPQVSNRVFLITVLTSDSFSIPVNTSNFDPFALGSSSQVPQVIPVGEVSSTLLMAERNNDNISPET